MTEFISEPITVDRSALRQDIDDQATTAIPGLKIVPGTPVDMINDIVASDSADLRQLLTQQLTISFRAYGEKVDRVTQNSAVQATAVSTWVRLSSSGSQTVFAGTQIDVPGSDGTPVTFQTVSDFTFTAGVLTMSSIAIVATTGGENGNGLTGTAQPTTTLAWLSSVTVTSTTAGGVDAEEDDEYLNRLADTRPGRAFTIVLIDDLARYLRNQAGVERALVIDNYNGDTLTGGLGGHATAIPIDSVGAALSSGSMTSLKTSAQALAVSGLTLHVIAPTFTTISVVFAGKADTGFDTADVLSRAVAAVQAFLSPATWGTPSSGDVASWNETTLLRFQDVSTILNNVQGFNHWEAPTGTATTTSGSPNLTLVTPTTGWVNGMPITGTGIPAATKILSGAGTATMVLTANATASATGVAITGSGLAVNGGTADVTLTGPGALPSTASTVAGAVT